MIHFKDILIFEDSSSFFRFEDIVNPTCIHLFRNETNRIKSFESTYWLKMTFSGESLQQRSWFLEGRDPNTLVMDFFIPQVGGGYKEIKMGAGLPQGTRPIPHKNFILELPNDFTEITLYLRVKSHQKNFFSFRLKSSDFVLGYAINEYLLLGIFYGIMLVMALYNLLLFLFVKDRLYLFYVLYVISSILTCLAEDGLGFQYLWSNFPQFNLHAEEITEALFLFFFVLYSNSFLELSKRHPRYFKVILTSTALAICSSFIESDAISDLTFTAIYTTPMFMVFLAGIMIIRDGYYPAKFYIRALSFVMVSTVLLIMNKSGIFDWEKFSVIQVILLVYAFNIALVFEVIMFSFGQARRLQYFQQEQETILQKSETRFRDIFETSFDAILVYDAEEEKIQQANQRAVALFGYPREDFEKISLTDLLLTKGDPQNCYLNFMCGAWEKESTPHTFCFTTKGIQKGGRKFYCEITISRLKDLDEPYFALAIKDISRQKTAEQNLTKRLLEIEEKNATLTKYIESNSELQNFAYTASHDMRQPIRTIKSFSQLLKKRLGQKAVLTPDTQEYLDFIISGSSNLENLVLDLLEHAKVSSLNNYIFQVTCFEEVLNLAKLNLTTQIEESKVIIRSSSLPTMTAEPTRMIQLFQNLISNAIKFRNIDRPCEIEIKAQESSKSWLFSIQDNGIGIPKDKQKEVFKAFTKLHGSHEYPGHGIGLATCQKIIEAHGGEFWIESELGIGTTFYFTLHKHPETLLLATDQILAT